MYVVRLCLASLWAVGQRRKWWKGVRGGDVGLFMFGLAALGVVFEMRPGAVQGVSVRKGLAWGRGEGWIDRGEQQSKEEEESRKRE